MGSSLDVRYQGWSFKPRPAIGPRWPVNKFSTVSFAPLFEPHSYQVVLIVCGANEY
jgi:hypothetical protein